MCRLAGIVSLSLAFCLLLPSPLSSQSYLVTEEELTAILNECNGLRSAMQTLSENLQKASDYSVMLEQNLTGLQSSYESALKLSQEQAEELSELRASLEQLKTEELWALVKVGAVSFLVGAGVGFVLGALIL